MALAPALVERLSWPAERLRAHRTVELRRLVQIAIERSPWHRRRLSRLCLETFDETALADLPAMTKDDLMEHFDEIVTDRRLSLDLVESHLGTLTGDAYLLGRYHAVASSGSSGRRGVFVFGWKAWSVRWLGNVRSVLRRCADPGSPLVFAKVAAGDPTHGTSALGRTFSQARFPVLSFPVTRPLREIVDGLNAAQPHVLIGYPSALYPLVHEASAGRLSIRPRWVLSTSEPLLPEVRRAVEDTWAVAVTNCWSASEAGGMAVSCEAGPGMHLSDDLVVVEPVDKDGGAVPPGTPSAKVYLTNFSNPTLPLIRYEIADQVTVLDDRCGCGSAHRRIADVWGRFDDVFVYGGLSVNPLAFESPLVRDRHVLEYQVRQTPHGATVAIRCQGPVDLSRLEAEIVGNLSALGLRAPEIELKPVDQLDRLPTGKLKRFLPLGTVPVRSGRVDGAHSP